MVRPQRGRKREGDSSVASKKVWEDKTMAAKEQTSARQSLTEKISTKEKISYGCGDLASNLILVLTSTFVAYFYTDALGLNAAIIGSIMMFSRFADGVTDMLMGYVMDRVKTKYGKARPWLLWLAIPIAVACVLVFLVPNTGTVGKYIYVTITYNLVTTFLYTMINIPYGALTSLMSRDQGQRTVINVFRMFMAQVGSLMVYMKSRVTALLEDLLSYFTSEKKVEQGRSGRERLQRASDYILQHYREEITLEDLADHLYLSRAYISRSFPRYFGVSFLEYVTQVRLAHAVQEMHSGATLTEISYRNGFVNETAMIRAFRKYRGMTPSEYRKQMKHTAEQSEKKGKEREETAEDHDIFQNLLQYAAVTEQEIETTNESAVSVTAAVNGRKPRVAGHWKRVINAGYAASVLNREVQDELEQLVQELGYEMIRVKGILDDDMCVLRRNMWGEIQSCWNYIDEVIDFILSTGAKPLLEFGHMPLLLAKTDPGRTLRPAPSSLPRDLAEWRMLIKNLMEHLKERYGINQMRRWIFNPWISGDAIMSDEGDAFFETWKASYDEMKRVSPDLVTCLSFGLGPEEHLKAFIETMKEKECVPEIFAFRSFGTVLYGEEEEKMNLIQNNESANMIVSRDPDFLRNRGEKVKGLLQKAGLGALPVLVDECSSNIWQRDLCNDTCYKAAWLFKNLLENEEALQGIAYFSVNDRLDEVFPARETYHGGFGLFTMNGIPKAVCTALRLLGRMGSRLVKRGDGYFISTEPEKNQSQIYLYNYVHYDMLYRYRHAVNISRTDRYRVFNMGEIRTFSVKLTGLEPGKYCLRLYKVTKEHGSSYDAWVRMGAPERMNRMERAMLCHSADPEYRVWEQETDPEGSLTVQERLEPHETALIEVEQIL